MPVQPVGLTSGVTSIAAGNRHACAVVNSADYLLGDNSTLEKHVPTLVQGLAGEIMVKVAAGSRHTCATNITGSLWCWDDNTYGQNGVLPIPYNTAPVLVSGLATPVTSNDPSAYNICAI